MHGIFELSTFELIAKHGDESCQLLCRKLHRLVCDAQESDDLDRVMTALCMVAASQARLKDPKLCLEITQHCEVCDGR